RVCREAAGEVVRSRAADQRVVAAAAIERIHAGTTVEDVVQGAASQRVGATGARQIVLQAGLEVRLVEGAGRAGERHSDVARPDRESRFVAQVYKTRQRREAALRSVIDTTGRTDRSISPVHEVADIRRNDAQG